MKVELGIYQIPMTVLPRRGTRITVQMTTRLYYKTRRGKVRGKFLTHEFQIPRGRSALVDGRVEINEFRR